MRRPISTNPLLAIVGNPFERTPAQLHRLIARKQSELDDAIYFRYAPDRIEQLREQLNDLFAQEEETELEFEKGTRRGWRHAGEELRREEYRRRLTGGGNPAHLPCVARAEREWEEAVAGVIVSGRVKKKRSKPRKKVRKNRTSAPGKKKPLPKKRKYSIEEARKKFKGVDHAVSAFKKFHGRNPDHVEIYEFDDGSRETTIDRAHAALHRTIETNYMVPWDSSKKGTLWKHEHVGGWGLEGQSGAEPDPEEFPLEIYDPATKTTRKIGGRFKVTDWWRD